MTSALLLSSALRIVQLSVSVISLLKFRYTYFTIRAIKNLQKRLTVRIMMTKRACASLVGENVVSPKPDQPDPLLRPWIKWCLQGRSQTWMTLIQAMPLPDTINTDLTEDKESRTQGSRTKGPWTQGRRVFRAVLLLAVVTETQLQATCTYILCSNLLLCHCKS